ARPCQHPGARRFPHLGTDRARWHVLAAWVRGRRSGSRLTSAPIPCHPRRKRQQMTHRTCIFSARCITNAERRCGGQMRNPKKLVVVAMLVLCALIASPLTPVIARQFVQAFQADGFAMAPAIGDGDRVLVDKTATSPGRTDVVIFRDPRVDGLMLIKRVI